MKALKCDLNKSILNIGYVGAVLLTTLLCFTAKAYTDPNTAKIYTVFECIAKLDKQLFADDYSFSSYLIFAKGMSGYMAMFLPIIAAFPLYDGILCRAKRRFNAVHHNQDRRIEILSVKILLSIFVRRFSRSIRIYNFRRYRANDFPSLSQYELSADNLSFVLVNNKNELIGVLRYMLSAFLYGAISTMPALFISSFCKNPYLITCVPFMVTYMWQITVQKLIANSMMKEDFDRASILENFYPNSIMNLSYYTAFADTKYILFFNFGIILFSVIGFIVIMNMRLDKGV